MSHQWMLPLGLLLLAQLSHENGVGSSKNPRATIPAWTWLSWSAVLASALPFLHRQVDLSLNALPEALTAKAVAMSLLCLLLLLMLAAGSTQALARGISTQRGMREGAQRPSALRSTSLFEFWLRLLPTMIQPGRSHFIAAMPALGLVALCASVWRGSMACAAIWLTLQVLLLIGEQRLMKTRWQRLPMLLRWSVTMGLMALGTQLWICPSVSEAAGRLMLLWRDQPINTFGLLLNKRLTLPPSQGLLVGCLLLAATHDFISNWLTQGTRARRLALGVFGVVAALLSLRELPLWPAWMRHALQLPLCHLGMGNQQVHLGYDGWLFDQAQWDRRTQQRRQPGLLQPCLKLASELKTLGVATLLIPVPAKMAMYPEQVLRAEYPGPVQPPGWAQTLDRLQQGGIKVLDPADALWNRVEFQPSHHPTDSHWTFAAMKATASAVAKVLRTEQTQVTSDSTPLVDAKVLDQSGPGDLALALLPMDFASPFAWEHEQVVGLCGLADDSKSPVAIATDTSLEVYGSMGQSFQNPPHPHDSPGDFATQLSALIGRKVHRLNARPIEGLAESCRQASVLLLLIPADDL